MVDSNRGVHYFGEFDLKCDNLTAEGDISVNNLNVNGSHTGVNLNGLDDVNISNYAAGNIVYSNGTEYRALPIGSALQFLGVVGGVPTWLDINSFRATGHMYFPVNLTSPHTITVSATNTWYEVDGLTGGEVLNVSYTSSVLTVGIGGLYLATGGITIFVDGVVNQKVRVGMGINGNDPVAADVVGATDIATVRGYTPIPVCATLRLNAGDKVQIMVRNDDTTENILVGSLQFNLVKIAN